MSFFALIAARRRMLRQPQPSIGRSRRCGRRLRGRSLPSRPGPPRPGDARYPSGIGSGPFSVAAQGTGAWAPSAAGPRADAALGTSAARASRVRHRQRYSGTCRLGQCPPASEDRCPRSARACAAAAIGDARAQFRRPRATRAPWREARPRQSARADPSDGCRCWVLSFPSGRPCNRFTGSTAHAR